ncbi:MAG: TRAP transporter small permease [Bacteroidota bacterium]
MGSLVKTIDHLLQRVLVFLMAIMVITVTWQVVTRFVLNNPSSLTEELATFLLIWISLLGGAYAFRVNAHLGVDALTRNLTASRKKKVRYFVSFSTVLFAAIIFIYGGSRLVYLTLKLEQYSAALRIPMGYVYIVLPLSGLLMVFYVLAELLHQNKSAGTAK